jgi:outer membrane protein assembly factor BamD (BamD/ComL family)
MSDSTSRAEAERSGAAVIELSDSVLVQNAVKELRHGGDAREASRLLERYRVQNPDGVLAEEALALSIEAAVAKRDPEAKLLARQYLSKYPNGRFAPAARRASQ